MTKRYAIRFSVVPPDASEVFFLMILINPHIEPAAAGSDTYKAEVDIYNNFGVNIRSGYVIDLAYSAVDR